MRLVRPPIDRHQDGMPSQKCMIAIWVDGEWLECEWHPRKEDSEADEGYLGTARTTSRPIQIGFHAWRQNDHEFRDYKILGDNAEVRCGHAALPKSSDGLYPSSELPTNTESMKKNQEPKYMIVATTDGYRIANRASEEVIPDDEPVMILLARDIHAREVIVEYARKCGNAHHAAVVMDRARQFADFAEQNPERMKEPDTANFSG